jgi:hypothetical protein
MAEVTWKSHALRLEEALEACRAERERLQEELRAEAETAGELRFELAEYKQRLADTEAALAATPTSPEPREGMVMVYDSTGAYLGCMGIERWQRLLEEDALISPAAEEDK